MVKLWPVRVKVKSGRVSRLSHSIVYWPLYDFLAPISLLLQKLVSSSQETTNRTQNLQEISKSAGESDEGSTGVKNGTGSLELGGLIAKSDGIKVNLPVSLAAERDLGHRTSVVVLVDTTKHGLRLGLLVVGITEVEREDGLVKQTLVDGRVERWDDTVDTDGVVSKTKDTVETAKGKGKTGLFGGFAEELVLDLEVTDLDGVLGNVSLYGS